MTKVQTTSTTWMYRLFVFVLLIFQSLLLHKSTHAFSPLLPASIGSVRYYTRQYLKSSRQRATTISESLVDTNNSTELNKGLATTSLPIRYDPLRIRFRCRIAYDGTSFAGFQLQGGRGGSGAKQAEAKNKIPKKQKKRQNNNPRTIQGEIERILSTRFQRVVKVLGAGRTDGGVHARGQAIHFDLYPNETIAKTKNYASANDFSFERDLECSMNRMLPSDIRAWNVGRAYPEEITDTGSKYTPPGSYNWNAMRSSTSKLYSYRISVGDAMNPTERHHRWQLPWPGVDPDRLEHLLKKFEGQHNFVCFAGALEQQTKKMGFAMGTIRTIHKIRFVKEANRYRNNINNMGGDPSEHYYRIDIYLDGALYKMVRNIIGTAVDVCREYMEEELLTDLLNKPEGLKYTRKDNPCVPAPPHGLTLERVFYPDDEYF